MTLTHWLTDESPASAWQARCGQTYRALARALKSPMTLAGSVVVLTLVLLAVLAPWLGTADPNAQDLLQRLQPASATHWLGTDQLGRDLWSRVLYGTRATLVVVVLVALLSAPLGLGVGICAGYFGGWLDSLLMRSTDIFMALPRLVLALMFVAVLGPGLFNAVLAITVTAWAPYARVARSETLAIRRSDFLHAARVARLPTWRILWGHVLPLCLPSTVIRVTLDMAGVILTAAGLGFLGLGAQPPLAEWGSMVAAGRSYVYDQWWVAAVPGAAILLASLAFNLLGDGLRDVLDPKDA
jgi:peptide/nickel transport system permease protein